MKRLAKNIVLFLVMTLALLFVLDKIFTTAITHDNYNKVWWMWGIKNQSYDYVILGNSRPLTNLSPVIIDKKFSTKGINLSLDDAQISSTYLMLKKFLLENNNATKSLILNIDPWRLNGLSKEETRIWCFLPYISDTSVYNHFQSFYPIKSVMWKHIPFYKYVDYNTKIGIHTIINTKLNVLKNPFDNKGYWPKNGNELNHKKKCANYKKVIVNQKSNAAIYFEKIITLCRNKDIKLMIFSSPVYNTCKQKNVSNSFDKYIKSLHVPYKNHLSLYGQADSSYFYDNTHLNKVGAKNFSLKMGKEIKQLLEN